MSMLEKLIVYFVRESDECIKKTQLVKFLYLADLYSVKWTEKQLTDLDWVYYLRGPWDQEIDEVLCELRNQEILDVSRQGSSHLIKPNRYCPSLDSLQLSQGLKLMLRNIRKEWIDAELAKLLEYVYQTEPMLEAKKYHKPKEKAKLNLQLEREKLIAELGV